MKDFTIITLTSSLVKEAGHILSDEWGSPHVVSRGRVFDTRTLPGLVALSGQGRIAGLLTYHIEREACEIITLNALEENRGIGTALIEQLKTIARDKGVENITLITTNDNIDALRFYQKRGFEMCGFYRNAIKKSRILKPSIPRIGFYGIPICHEIEFTLSLERRHDINEVI